MIADRGPAVPDSAFGVFVLLRVFTTLNRIVSAHSEGLRMIAMKDMVGTDASADASGERCCPARDGKPACTPFGE